MRTVNHIRMPKPLLDLYADCELPRNTLIMHLKNCYSSNKKLRVILRGSSPNNESSWKVKYIRQRVQRQYKWKPEKKYMPVLFVCNCTINYAGGFWPGIMLTSLNMILMSKKFCEIVFLICYAV